MYKKLIESYIKNMNFEDVKSYISKNYKDVSEDEVKVIYKYIKNRWEEIYDENPTVLEELKKEVSSSTYERIIELLKTAMNLKKR